MTTQYLSEQQAQEYIGRSQAYFAQRFARGADMPKYTTYKYGDLDARLYTKEDLDSWLEKHPEIGIKRGQCK